eukprot:ANDGO_08458.mRNA.1 heparan-alpha-glucosaminide N-acetyltransferase
MPVLNLNESRPLLPLAGGPASSVQSINSGEPTKGNATLGARLLALDVFRGATMVGMIIVDNQGDFSKPIFPPFDETEWEGIQLADCIFPSFLFIMGMSAAFSLSKKSKTWALLFNILRRAALLFLIGLWLNVQARKFKTPFRVMGVLQRLGIVYGVISLGAVFLNDAGRRLVMFLFLALYAIVMYSIKVPDYSDCDRGDLSPTCNPSGYIDREVYGKYMIHPTDPEGLWSTLTSCVTGLFGYEFGLIWQRYKSKITMERLCAMWMTFAFVLISCAYWLQYATPFNKKLWSVSFTLITSGFSGAVLCFCTALCDIFPSRLVLRLVQPLRWLGTNPLVVFVGMVFLGVLFMDNITVSDGQTLWLYLYENMFKTWVASDQLANFLWSFVHVLLWTTVAGVLYKAKIFIRL